jgi:PleD family two-component response regulator
MVLAKQFASAFAAAESLSVEVDSSDVLDAPVLPPDREDDSAVSENDLPDHPSAFEGKARILVVDDDPVNLRVVANHLSFQNIRVSAALSGKDALERSDPMPLLRRLYDIQPDFKNRVHNRKDVPIIFFNQVLID